MTPPFGQQIGDATRQHCSLARAGSRDYQQRRTGMDHGLALLRVETLEEGVRTRVVSPPRAAPPSCWECPSCSPSAGYVFIACPRYRRPPTRSSVRPPAGRGTWITCVEHGKLDAMFSISVRDNTADPPVGPLWRYFTCPRTSVHVI